MPEGQRGVASTIRSDAPHAAFFGIGAGVGVCLTAIGSGPAVIIGGILALAGALILSSRYAGFPIPALRPKQDPRRQVLADRLGERAQEAQDFVGACFQGRAGRDRAEAAADEWERSTHDLIDGALGRGEAHVFRVGMSQEPPSKAVGWTMQYFDTRAHRLSDLITRLPHLQVRDDWQP